VTRTVVVTNDFGNHVGPGTDLVQEAFCDPTETLIDCGVQAGTLSNGNEVDLSGSFYHVAGLRRVEPSGGAGPSGFRAVETAIPLDARPAYTRGPSRRGATSLATKRCADASSEPIAVTTYDRGRGLAR
jgi:hypothetical protein